MSDLEVRFGRVVRWGHFGLAGFLLLGGAGFVVLLIGRPSLLTVVLVFIGIAGSSYAVYRLSNVAYILGVSALGLRAKTFVGRNVSIAWRDIDQLQRWPAQSIPPTEFVRVVARDGRSLTFNSRMFKSATVSFDDLLRQIQKEAPAVRQTKVPRHVRFLTG